jgi:AraC-like DNA-binding protein
LNTSLHIDGLSAFILIGIFQGFILSFFFIFKRSQNSEANRYQGFLLLALILGINEQFLNMTGLITRMLFLTNTSEPLNLVIGPLLYLYVKRSTDREEKKGEWIHFILPALYLLYMCQDYIQSNDYKYNSYVNSFHPDWPLLNIELKFPDDFLGLKKHLNSATVLQITFYVWLSFSMLLKKTRTAGEKLFQTSDQIIRSLRNMIIHILAIIIIFITVKMNFQGDLGDYFIGMYVAAFSLLTTIRVINDSSYFDKSASFMDISIGKYQKSSLNEQRKLEILDSILHEFEKKNYFSGNLASLSDLSKRLGVSQHHVSQVINEKLNKNFFELLASYRIEKAKKILHDDRTGKITIEELSEMVGYNSKTAFNNSFRKLTGKTPSEFRKIKS